MIVNDKYIQIDIKINSSEQKDILIAELSGRGYEFEEERTLLKAFIKEEDYDENEITNLLSNKGVTYSLSTILNKNWNAEWEAGFQPVIIDDYCCIRAGFHSPVAGITYDIIINPQMSFGTGHHATTYMMVQAMRSLEFRNKSVFDFGTGTGILAILAGKLGAGTVTAIDNDDWSIENARENFRTNNSKSIKLIKAGTLERVENNDLPPEKSDIILANINRNIILRNLPFMKEQLAANGVILLSGLLEDDKSIILEAAKKEGLKLIKELKRESWICLALNAAG